jgi:hypothetical protein
MPLPVLTIAAAGTDPVPWTFGQPFKQGDVPDYVTAKPLTHFEACLRLAKALGRSLTVDENTQVQAWFPEGVNETDIARIAEAITQGSVPQGAATPRPALRIVSAA